MYLYSNSILTAITKFIFYVFNICTCGERMEKARLTEKRIVRKKPVRFVS